MNIATTNNALITGGSCGLGLGLALALGRKGARIAIVARRAPLLDAALKTLLGAGIDAYAIEGDIGDEASAAAIAAKAHHHLGHIDLLIHNASTLGPLPMPNLGDLDSEDFLRVLQVNLLGPHRLTKAIGGHMALRGQGTIVSISSDAAKSAYEGWGAYSAAKVALDHMGQIWAEETRDLGLRFLSVDPGEMRTQMHADALPDSDPTTLASPDEVARNIVEMLSHPDVQTGSRWLASDFGVEL